MTLTYRPARGARPPRRAAAFLAALLLPALALAQTGTISGTVVDGGFGSGLPGASVLVEELGTGAATDIDGNYQIRNVPVGTYTVRFSFIGYGAQTVENVEVAAGETAQINVELSEGAELAEVVVEAEEIIETNNEVGLLRVRQRAAAVSDAISAEAIAEAGASTAAEAAERITGASVVGGKFVVVRGLGDRYANTQLNGAALPTADPDRRSVQFDLFPSDFLESITTIKTFTPDQPGDFSGGIVDIQTRSLPPAFTARFSASNSVNTAVHFSDGFLRSPSVDVGFLPTGASDRAVPDLLVGNDALPFGSAGPARSQARTDEAFRAELDQAVRAFDSVAAVDPDAGAPVNQGYALSVGNRFTVGGNPLGFLLGLTYDRGASSYDDGVTGRFRTSSVDAETGRVGLFPNLLVNDARSTIETSLGGIGNVAYQVGSLHEVGANAIYSRIGESEARFQSGAYPEQYGIEDETTLFVNRTFGYTEREIASVQPRGRHRLPALGDLELDWTGTFSRTTQDQPDQQFLPLVREERGTNSDGSTRYLLRPQILGSLSPAIRFFRALDEDLLSLQANAALPFGLSGRRGELKVGGRYNRTDRTVDELRLQYDPTGAIPVGDDNLGDYRAYLADDRVGFVGEDSRGRPIIGTLLSDVTLPTNNYTGYLDVPAAYVQAEVPVLPGLRAIGGVRYEGTLLNVETGPITEDSTAIGRIDVADFLPALNLVYALGDDMNLRAAASRTLARPTFREIGPFESVNFALDNPEVGNPALDRTLITNYDLRWEWFVRPGDLLAASFYYKDLQSPIERVILNLNGLTSFQNVEQAEVYGVELEARTGLGVLSRRLSDLSVGLNLTFTESSISLSPDELELRRRFNPTAPATRALQGQSPYIVNADLNYDNDRLGTSLGVYFNVFGARLSRVSVAETPDVFEQPRPQLDLIASQRLLDQVSLKVTAKNILNTRFREEYDQSGGVTTTLPVGRGFDGFGYTFQEYGLGTSFSVGLSFSPRLGGLASPRVPSPGPPN